MSWRLGYYTLAWVSGLLLLGSAAAGVGWFASGGRVYSVQTGSMVPAFRPGDAVIVRKTTAQSLRVGQVIAYHSRQHPGVIVSHRLIARNQVAATLVTKGDHNHLADTAVPDSQTIGRVVAVAPHLGSCLRILRSPLGLTFALYLPALGLIVGEVWRASRRLPAKTYRQHGYYR